MGPEIWVGIAAVFVSGGAVGAAGVLLSQWVVRKISDDPPRGRTAVDGREVAMLRGEVADLARKVHNLDARLDFQEQLLGGATPTTRPPPRLEPGDLDESDGQS